MLPALLYFWLLLFVVWPFFLFLAEGRLDLYFLRTRKRFAYGWALFRYRDPQYHPSFLSRLWDFVLVMCGRKKLPFDYYYPWLSQ